MRFLQGLVNINKRLENDRTTLSDLKTGIP